MKKKQKKYVYCPPTWEAVIMIYVEAYARTGKAEMKEEILRCAKLADLYVKGAK